MNPRTGCLMAVLLILSSLSSNASDKAFIVESAVNVGAIAFDAYTTTWIRPHWLATPRNVIAPCNVEGSEPWLYGKHPTVSRTWAVSAGEIALTEFAALALRHNHKLKRFSVLAFYRAPTHVAFGIHNVQDCGAVR